MYMYVLLCVLNKDQLINQFNLTYLVARAGVVKESDESLVAELLSASWRRVVDLQRSSQFRVALSAFISLAFHPAFLQAPAESLISVFQRKVDRHFPFASVLGFYFPGSGASRKVLDFSRENFRTWKVPENHFGPEKARKLMLEVLESPGKISLKVMQNFFLVVLDFFVS